MELTEFDEQKIIDEFTNWFRANLNNFDTKNRVEEKIVEKITETNQDIYFISNKLSFIKSIEYNGDVLKYGKDYEILYRGENKGSAQLNFTPSNGNTLLIVYGDVVKSNFIYADFPLTTLGDDQYPRLGFLITWSRDVAAMKGKDSLAINNNGLLQVKIVDKDKNNIMKWKKNVDDFLKKNFKGVYSVRFIEPSDLSDYDNFEDNTQNTFEKVLNYNLPNKYEIVNGQ